MTPTIKDPPEVTSPTKAASQLQSAENGHSPRSNPVCLEVPVTIRSLPGELGANPESSAPIREDGRTVIVFDNGAVLRLANPLPVGQTVILSNQQGRDVVCKVAGGRNLPNIKGYIEVEFIEPVNDFWQVHQNAEPAGVPSALFPLGSTQSIPSLLASQPAGRVGGADGESSGSAPSFEDIAGLVRMSPPAVVREKKAEPASNPVSRGKDESAHRQAETAKPVAATSVVVPTFVPQITKPVTAVVEEVALTPARSQTFSNDLTGRGAAASANSLSPSISLPPVSPAGESRGKMTLIGGGVALVLLGFGAGFLFMHKGSAPAIPSAVVANQSSGQLTNTASGGPAAASLPDLEQTQRQVAQPISTAASVPVAVDKIPAAVEPPRAERQTNTADSKQDRTPTRSSSIANLKMGSPTAPRQDLAKMADGSSLSEADLTATSAVGGRSAGALLSSVAHPENQPAPPPSAAPRVAVTKTITDPKLISSTQAIYPDIAKQTKVQGKVVLAINVDTKGNVIDAKAVSGPILLRQAAMDAVRRWKYSPALFDGKPTVSQITVSLDFRMN